MSTREGFPELWGLKEIADYGEELAIESGDPPRADGRHVSMQRAQDWTRRKSFPEPVAQLAMGSVYLAEEVAPKVEEIMGRARTMTTQNRGGVAPEIRAAILAEKSGPDGRVKVAERYGVNETTVQRIWRGRR